MKILDQEMSNNWAMYQGDCVEVIKSIPTESVHYSIFSPPFSNLFTYSDSERDIGNCKNDDEFYKHFDFLTMDLLRVLKPGRLVSIHCMDSLATMTHDGFIGLKDMPGLIISLFESAGFIYHSRVCIWKDPLLQAVRTKALALAHKQISKDSTRCAMGLPDYIVTMRKPGTNKEPVSHGRGLEKYIGDQPEPTEKKTDDARTNKYSHHVWQRYASPVWWDIRQTNTLNIQAARSEKDEKHICPLQLDTIARCLELWTNKDDTVLSPFAGIGSEGYQSLLDGRRFIGIELKESYYKQAVRNLQSTENKQKQINLFDEKTEDRILNAL
jgi:DNA modification methylase